MGTLRRLTRALAVGRFAFAVEELAVARGALERRQAAGASAAALHAAPARHRRDSRGRAYDATESEASEATARLGFHT